MSALLRRFPALMFVAGLLIIGGALSRELIHRAGPRSAVAVTLLGIYLGWMLLEARITFRTATDRSSAADRGSEQLYGLARLATVLAALYLPPAWTRWHPVLVLAPLLMLAGIWLRLAAIRALGRFYSHRVRTVADHRIARTGPYRPLRHPAYAGMILAHLGLVLYFLNPVSVLALTLLFVPAIVRRILVEEDALFGIAGYAEFAATRKRLVPFLW
jgi:protein-S-isoprenylcysteine O-methyltransferase Ste14